MNFKTKILIATICTVFILQGDLFAQTKNQYRKEHQKSRQISHYKGGSGSGKFRSYHYVGFGINALNYYGDLAPVNRAGSTDISFTRPGFGIQYGFRFHPLASARITYNWGRLRGDDNTSDPSDKESGPRYHRNLSFRNDITEFTLGFEFYIIPDRSGPTLRMPINAYVFLGGGWYHHQPKGLVPEYDHQTGGTDKLKKGGEWVRLQPLGTEGQNLASSGKKPYGLSQWNIPLGIGGIMRLPGHFNIGLELGYRFTFTDYLDDVSGNYVDLDKFDNKLARIMSDRSAEPVAAVTKEKRKGLSLVQNTYPSGETYTISGYLGSGNDGSNRGGKDKDMYFITQVRVTYILSKKARSTAKFR